MPIFEFRCLECGSIFEKLFIDGQEQVEIKCPRCNSESFDRVISKTNYVMGAGKDGKKPKLTSKSCSPGSSCYTLELPGPGE
ncbi:MAG: FmdB family zinc ribbon protein [Desulfotomaculales bacterium]